MKKTDKNPLGLTIKNLDKLLRLVAEHDRNIVNATITDNKVDMLMVGGGDKLGTIWYNKSKERLWASWGCGEIYFDQIQFIAGSGKKDVTRSFRIDYCLANYLSQYLDDTNWNFLVEDMGEWGDD